MNDYNFPEFSPERETITKTFNQMLNNSNFAPLEQLPPHLENILSPYPQSAAKLKKYYHYPAFPKEYLVYTMSIYFNEQKVFRWVMGIQLTLPKPNLETELVRIDVMEQLALLVYKGEIIFDRISEVEIGSVVSALNNWFDQSPFKTSL
jgi:hypothetical protein